MTVPWARDILQQLAQGTIREAYVVDPETDMLRNPYRWGFGSLGRGLCDIFGAGELEDAHCDVESRKI